MCGVAVLLDSSKSYNRVSIVKKMLEAQKTRGPDAYGIKDFGSVVVGHNLLKILPCPNSKQPISTANSQYTISFNGEIYNYRELRNNLLKIGINFQTNTDTEVIGFCRIYELGCVL